MFTIRHALPGDEASISQVERACFPSAEAASPERIRDRVAAFPTHFYLMFDGERLVSFVHGFVTDQADLSDDMFAVAAQHSEQGRWQMIFSVATLPDYRRRGCAAILLHRMISDARAQGRLGLVLTCKEHMLHYYARFGFVSEGLSASDHGGAVWYQMRLAFPGCPAPLPRLVQASPCDEEELLALYRSVAGLPGCTWGEDYPSAALLREDLSHGAVYVVRSGSGSIVSAVSVTEDEVAPLPFCAPCPGPSVGVARIAVSRESQGCGLSRRMLTKLFDVLRAQGVRCVRLLVSEQNLPAWRNYLTLGFQPIGECDLFGTHWTACELMLG